VQQHHRIDAPRERYREALAAQRREQPGINAPRFP
jgi:hypothetical protein